MFSFNSIAKHKKIVHESNTGVSCPICDKYISQRHRLEIHIKSKHYQIREYKCSLCEKAYARQGHLERHVTSAHFEQTNKKPRTKFRCDYCEKEFDEHHMKTDKPYEIEAF